MWPSESEFPLTVVAVVGWGEWEGLIRVVLLFRGILPD